jgi:hypothetical protein
MDCVQIPGAFPWDEAPHYLIRDRDRIYGCVVTRRLRARGIRDKQTARLSWERFIQFAAVCTENLIRVDDVTESPKLAE